jgi:hypothetical protein
MKNIKKKKIKQILTRIVVILVALITIAVLSF